MKTDFKSGPVMTEARFVSSSGEVNVISLDDYKEHEHRGRLICRHCDSASVYYHSGSHSIGGDNGGNAKHFHTFPQNDHADNCEYGMRLAKIPYDPNIDYSIGCRFNLNIDFISGVFNDVSKKGPARNRIRTPSDAFGVRDFFKMETLPLHNVQDFKKYFRSVDPTRIQQSMAVWHDYVVPWGSFFKSGERIEKHIERMISEGDSKRPMMFYLYPISDGVVRIDNKQRECVEFKCAINRSSNEQKYDIRLRLYGGARESNLNRTEPLVALCSPVFFEKGNILYLNIRDDKNIANMDIMKEVTLGKERRNAARPKLQDLAPSV